MNEQRGAGRVLIVDDEPGIVGFVSRFLSAEGYAVDEADNGVDGLAMAVEHAYDTILLDLVLPGLGGREVLRRLREKNPSQPVVVISSTADRALREDCVRRGATLLSKPFTLSELLAVTRSTSASITKP